MFRKFFKFSIVGVLIFCNLAFVNIGFAQKVYTGKPVTKNGVINSLSQKYKAADIIKIVESQGVNFEVTPEVKKELIKAGASSKLIEAINQNFRGAVAGSPSNIQGEASGNDSSVGGGGVDPGSSSLDTSVAVTADQSFDTVLGSFYNPLSFNRPEEVVVRLIDLMLLLVGIISVIMIILGGLRMVASGGSESQIKKGRETVTWAIGGLLVSLMAFSIVAIIQSIIS